MRAYQIAEAGDQRSEDFLRLSESSCELSADEFSLVILRIAHEWRARSASELAFVRASTEHSARAPAAVAAELAAA